MNTENAEPKASPKPDRRVRKTRALLLQGLVQLMKEKDIKDISVKELSDLVDINRGTFYLHYNDIYDMVSKIEEELFVEFNNILNRDISEDTLPDFPHAILVDIFTFLERHKELAQVMLGPHGDLTFVNHLKHLVKEQLMQLLDPRSSETYEYSYAFITSGCIGVIQIWLASPTPHTPEYMANLCSRILTNGVWSGETD
ncbi:MAG: TetR/AcrR family transcriptional regulator [Lachnoclostridium sp.]|nr:TetR/AcrR family transcriptional regulator [Lachnospira sp.]MCM1248803.1 TetR/AcrR family transcriptional regulator [Lachnoclostridium sp.]